MKPNTKEGLTVMVTTYNRLKRFKNIISSLNKNPHHGEYEILIVDNCSPDYNWDELIMLFDEDLRPSVRIERRRFNCGMSCNISSCFLLVETKWCLYLADDDFFKSSSLDIVFDDMKLRSDYCAVKYTLEGYAVHPNVTINNLNEYINYFSCYKDTGDAIYLSMLYNMEVLNNSMILNTSYSYTFIGFLLPVWDVLIKQKAPLFLSSNSIVKYKQAVPGSHWSYFSVVLGLCTLFDVPLEISFPKKKALFKLALDNFSMRLIFEILYERRREERKYCERKIYYTLLKPLYGYKAFLRFRFPFYIRHFLGCDVYKFFDKLRK